MTLLQLLALLVIAGICGAIGRAIAGYSHGGCVISIVVGFIGALLGMWLQGLTGIPDLLTIEIDGKGFPILWSILGSALFVAVINFLTYRRRV
jgi:uncharacterized membrane protein YeaQ/YmgE (transglycosylase-associated protein family)